MRNPPVRAVTAVIIGVFAYLSGPSEHVSCQPTPPPTTYSLWFTSGGAVGESATFHLHRPNFPGRPFVAVWSVNPPNMNGVLFPPFVPAATGNLDATGNATFLISVPNLPALVGTVIYVGAGVLTTTQLIARTNTLTWPIAGANTPTARKVATLAANAMEPTTTALADGRFLLSGGGDGFNPGSLSKSVLAFDPTTSQLTTVGSMTTARWYHCANQLSDGRVLIVGIASSTTGSAEFYDPVTNTSTPFMGSGSILGYPHYGVNVRDPGSQREWVFYAGGYTIVYDAQANNFRSTTFATRQSSGAALAPLVGRPEVALVGGLDSRRPTDRVDVYNCVTRTLRMVGRLTRIRVNPTALALDQRYLLVVDHDIELFDLQTGRGTLLPFRLRYPRLSRHTMGIGTRGKPIVCGGRSGQVGGPDASILMEELSLTESTPLRPLTRLPYSPTRYTFNRRGEILVTAQRDVYLVR